MMMDTSIAAVERPAYLIRKHGGYYRPNKQGYTGSAIIAGRYTLADAKAESHPNGPDGPRDGMTYVHEDEVTDEDWVAVRALSARNEALEAQLATARDALENISQWNLPPSGLFYPNTDGKLSDRPVPYDSSFANGAQGGIGYFRSLAARALTTGDTPND